MSRPVSAPIAPSSMKEWDRGEVSDDLVRSWQNELDPSATHLDLGRAAPAQLPRSNPAASQATYESKGEEVRPTLGISKPLQPWIVDLAIEERRLERDGLVSYSVGASKQDLLKRRTLEFTTLLRKEFQEQIDLFNQARKSPAHMINLYRVSNTAEDFMLYRNAVKLVVSGSRGGEVSFIFNQYFGHMANSSNNHEIKVTAEWGAFDQLFWAYKNDRINVADMVQYFITEFARQSFR